MKQETYNKLEDIIHDLYEFTSMIELEAKESAMKSGGLTGEIARINKVMFRIISDLKTTKLHLHDVEKMKKLTNVLKTIFLRLLGLNRSLKQKLYLRALNTSIREQSLCNWNDRLTV